MPYRALTPKTAGDLNFTRQKPGASLKAKLVVPAHYHDIKPHHRQEGLWRRYTARLVKAADVVHAASVYEARLLEERFAARPVVVEHGVDEDVTEVQWAPRDYAMYSGRLGHRLSWRYTAKAPPPRLERALKKMGLDYSIDGFQPRRRYLEKLAGVALYGLLSTHEAYGQAANETNAIGVPTLVAKPWGEHFAARPRTLAVDPHEDAEKIAEKAARLIEEAPRQPKPRVPTWSETVEIYIAKLYSPQ